MTLRWLTAFLDFDPETYAAGSTFWSQVADSSLSESRGAHREFATLIPADGDSYLRVQRLGSAPGGVHLDLHTEDATALAWSAISLGATEVARPTASLIVLHSPGGLPFCVTEATAWRRPATWPGIADQVCIDVAPGAYEAEVEFWQGLTLWSLRRSRVGPFSVLERPEGMPLRVMLQRLDDDSSGPIGAHLDLTCGSAIDEILARHQALGASVVRETKFWTTLRDPAGRTYCLTRRDPATGQLP